MIRMTSLIALAVLAAACQPQKTPEQIAAEQQAEAIQKMTAGMAAAFGQAGGSPADQQAAAQMAAGMIGAMAQSGASDMTPEEAAKAQAVLGAMASGKTHPAATAYLAGANKAFAIIGTVKDMSGIPAAKAQLAPVYAEMMGPSAQLKAMSQDERDIAMSASAMQWAALSMNAASLMMPLASNQPLAEAVGDLLDDMPSPE